MKFFKVFFASLLAIIVFFSLLFFLFFISIAALSSSAESSAEVEMLSGGNILEIDLESPIVEYTESNPFIHLDIEGFENLPQSLEHILSTIRDAKSNERIKAIFLNTSTVSAGIATTSEIRNALEDFKASGKPVYAFARGLTQKGLYLASVADTLAMHPQGFVELKGLSAQVMFFKNALAQIGIQPQVIRHGKFKSAVEPFLLDKMSESNKEQTKVFIDEIWGGISESIAKKSSLSEEELNANIALGKYFDVQSLHEDGVIDLAVYKSEFEEMIKSRLKLEKLTYMEHESYKPRAVVGTTGKVSVLYADGEIQGEGDGVTIKKMVKAIKKIKKDDDIKAVVLRVNSPGGSALVSDVIWKELMLLRESKPLVVSMGDYAASGGYYIATPGEKIFAQPNTITGSIGVFGLMFNAEELIKEKMEISIDGYKTHEFADIGSTFRPLNTSEQAIIQRSVEEIYSDFISKVADSRSMTTAQVDSIGQGRVWTGEHALKIGLVDTLGGVQDAIAYAAKQVDLETYSVSHYPKRSTGIMAMLEQMGGVSIDLGPFSELFGKKNIFLQSTTRQDKIMARMPFDMTID